MEIGSAYALQVCLLQIPAMVAFSAWYDPLEMGKVADTFTCVILPKFEPFPLSKTPFPCQVDLPSLGRDCHHTVDLPLNLHVHRSEGELPSRKHPRFEVRCFPPSVIYRIKP